MQDMQFFQNYLLKRLLTAEYVCDTFVKDYMLKLSVKLVWRWLWHSATTKPNPVDCVPVERSRKNVLMSVPAYAHDVLDFIFKVKK